MGWLAENGAEEASSCGFRPWVGLEADGRVSEGFGVAGPVKRGGGWTVGVRGRGFFEI